MLKETIEIPDNVYPLVMELFDHLGVVVQRQERIADPVKDAVLIESLIAARNEGIEHPEQCKDLELEISPEDTARIRADHEAFHRGEGKTYTWEETKQRAINKELRV